MVRQDTLSPGLPGHRVAGIVCTRESVVTTRVVRHEKTPTQRVRFRIAGITDVRGACGAIAARRIHCSVHALVGHRVATVGGTAEIVIAPIDAFAKDLVAGRVHALRDTQVSPEQSKAVTHACATWVLRKATSYYEEDGYPNLARLTTLIQHS